MAPSKKIFYMVFLLSLIVFSSFKEDDNSEKAKFSNFVKSISNESTFSYFTVITVKNLNTGEIKELCTKGNFVSGALHRELNLDYDNKGERQVLQYAKKRKNRYFEFRNKEALENISFFTYDEEMVKVIGKKYDTDSAIAIIEKKQKFTIRLDDDEMKAFAHVLFNKGYLTGEDNCFGGALEYVNRDWAKMLKE